MTGLGDPTRPNIGNQDPAPNAAGDDTPLDQQQVGELLTEIRGLRDTVTRLQDDRRNDQLTIRTLISQRPGDNAPQNEPDPNPLENIGELPDPVTDGAGFAKKMVEVVGNAVAYATKPKPDPVADAASRQQDAANKLWSRFNENYGDLIKGADSELLIGSMANAEMASLVSRNIDPTMTALENPDVIVDAVAERLKKFYQSNGVSLDNKDQNKDQEDPSRAGGMPGGGSSGQPGPSESGVSQQKESAASFTQEIKDLQRTDGFVM